MNFRLMQPRVRTRLYAGFGVLIMLGVAVAGFSIDRLRTIAEHVAIMGGPADESGRLEQAILGLEQANGAGHCSPSMVTMWRPPRR